MLSEGDKESSLLRYECRLKRLSERNEGSYPSALCDESNVGVVLVASGGAVTASLPPGVVGIANAVSVVVFTVCNSGN